MSEAILNSQFFGLYKVFSWIFIILDIILIFGIIFSIYKAWKFRPDLGVKPKIKKKTVSLRYEVFRERWFDIMNKFEVGSQIAWKSAVFEADKLIDDILKEIGISGKNIEERLFKVHPESLESFPKLLEAHHFCKDIAQNNLELNEEETKKILSYYEEFLKEIGVIL
jgi:hypothetical protein